MTLSREIWRQTAVDEFQYSLDISKATTSSSEDVCSICLGTIITDDEVTWLPCFHKFHAGCINRSLRSDNRCPVCRADTFYLLNLGKFSGLASAELSALESPESIFHRTLRRSEGFVPNDTSNTRERSLDDFFLQGSRQCPFQDMSCGVGEFAKEIYVVFTSIMQKVCTHIPRV